MVSSTTQRARTVRELLRRRTIEFRLSLQAVRRELVDPAEALQNGLARAIRTVTVAAAPLSAMR